MPKLTLMDGKIVSITSHSISVKRCFDVVFSLLALTLLSPLFLLLTILIKVSSRGEAIYAQERLGLHGKPFACYKFRTMVEDAEKKLEIMLRDPQVKREWQAKQKLRSDPRIFPLGKLLRISSLDELPQLWNVLRGDMSLVGPRPYTLDQKGYLGRKLHKILSVRPGITGLWQTSGRNSLSFQQRIELDCKYIDTSSFFYDQFLILKTIPTLLLAKDAY